MGYRFNLLKPTDPYYAQWADRRRRAVFFWIAFVAWLPATALNIFFVHLVLGPSGAWIFLGALPPVAVMTGFHLFFFDWRCPRCGNTFYQTVFLYWPFADNCLHCGLPEYAPRDESAGAQPSMAITAHEPGVARQI
jgi:hypothetical protein